MSKYIDTIDWGAIEDSMDWWGPEVHRALLEIASKAALYEHASGGDVWSCHHCGAAPRGNHTDRCPVGILEFWYTKSKDKGDW